MSVVTFKQDIFPYCKGDVVTLEPEEKQRVDQQIKLRGLAGVYVSGDKHDDVMDTVDGHQGASVQRAVADRKATTENNIDQAAVLEAQRTAVAEPANVDALGVIAEEPQTVTGTEPVSNVTVKNPQAATNPGSDEGVDIKTTKKTGK